MTQEKHLITVEAGEGDTIIINFEGDKFILPDKTAMDLAQAIAQILRFKHGKTRRDAA